ncbi:MAG: FAD-dependent oxidoreductase [Candidatus Atribacteria bacterium]|nr:FAD-dependent oxidoreductase [Candidatus Atribacteria bacterium]
MEKSILVVGGGIAGMTAALEAARQGLRVFIVEKNPELGGQMRGFKTKMTADGVNLAQVVAGMIQSIMDHPLIAVYARSYLKDVKGFVGNFESQIDREGEIITVKHGGVIIATGGNEYHPQEYRYGEDPRVITQTELEKALDQKTLPAAKNVVMIQCVGSRNDKHPWCSKICCTTAIKNAQSASQPGRLFLGSACQAPPGRLCHRWYLRLRMGTQPQIRGRKHPAGQSLRFPGHDHPEQRSDPVRCPDRLRTERTMHLLWRL